MPPMIIWRVSSLRSTRSVGSSSARRAGRRREQVADGADERAHAELFGGGTADHRADLAFGDARPQTSLDLIVREGALVEVLLQQAVVALGRGLDELFAALLDQRGHVV